MVLVPGCMISGLVFAASLCAYPQVSSPSADSSSDPSLGHVLMVGQSPISLSSLSATRERPLFSPSRRPPPPVATPVASPVAVAPPPKPTEPDPPALTLVGTIIGQGRSIGIFRDQASKTVVRLGVGQDHAGWRLRAIEMREAIFEKDQRQVTVAMPTVRANNQQGISVPPQSAAASGDTWRDGDGQLISPPPMRRSARN